jgi:hypothetical protein
MLAVLIGLPFKLHAVAYCALRDPMLAIQTFYPGFTSYRSYLGVVGPDLRRVLDETLPYQLHFNEFGKHTLYVAYAGEKAIGLVHARSEKGDWGLDEIVWSFNMDLTVRDFRFQRSRSRWKDNLQDEVFKQALRGKGIEGLLQFLDADGSKFSKQISGLPPEAEKLAATVVRSALNTIVVTEYVWGDRLQVGRE